MKLLALLLAIALTAGYGYVAQAAMATDAARFHRMTAGPDAAAVWHGGTLPPLVVTGFCQARRGADADAARRSSFSRGAVTLPAIVVTARGPTSRHLATACRPASAAGWHVD